MDAFFCVMRAATEGLDYLQLFKFIYFLAVLDTIRQAKSSSMNANMSTEPPPQNIRNLMWLTRLIWPFMCRLILIQNALAWKDGQRGQEQVFIHSCMSIFVPDGY